MNKLVDLSLIVMFAIVLGACSPTPQLTAKLITPGDKIGNFLITTDNNADVIYQWKMSCVKQSAEKESCTSTVGARVNVSFGIYDDTYSGKLDSLWAAHTYAMVIEGRPVNLQSFGSIDVTHPLVGKMRHWNVVVVTDKPGEITIQHSGQVGGNPFDPPLTYTLTFSAP